MEQNANNKALLVMDMQNGIVSMLPDNAALLKNAARAISHARKNHIPVIYVIVGFRPGLPEISMSNKGFTASKERFLKIGMDEFMKVHTHVAPAEGEITVIKRRVSAFTGSDLEVLLRAQDIKHLILTGVSTSGVVLSTTREAADKDYKITIISDCCGDGDAEVHRVLTTKVFLRQADVITLEEFEKTISF
jgi:nicotinamidase-related amidase